MSRCYLISVDPGVHTGVAVWGYDYGSSGDGSARLEAATLVQGVSSPVPSAECVDDIGKRVGAWARRWTTLYTTCVIEFPKLYEKDRTSPKDLNDFLLVSAVAASVRAHLGVMGYFIIPADWKGQMKKPKKASDPYIVEARAKTRMTPEELALVPHYANSIRHNLWDAIGIGLHETGRPIKDPIRVFAR